MTLTSDFMFHQVENPEDPDDPILLYLKPEWSEDAPYPSRPAESDEDPPTLEAQEKPQPS